MKTMISKRTVSNLSLMVLLGLTLTTAGCARRFITAQTWALEKDAKHTLIVAYLEDKCLGSYCTAPRAKVTACLLKPEDNSLTCKISENAEKALNP